MKKILSKVLLCPVDLQHSINVTLDYQQAPKTFHLRVGCPICKEVRDITLTIRAGLEDRCFWQCDVGHSGAYLFEEKVDPGNATFLEPPGSLQV
jgi:hypothetical protein